MISAGQVTTFATRINRGAEPADFSWFLENLPAARRERIRSFRRKEDAIRTLTGDCMVRTLLRQAFGEVADTFAVHTHECGKPYCRERPDFHFNVSHSGDWIICSVSDAPVGADVERVRDIKENVFRKVLNNDEFTWARECPNDESLKRFHRLWTLKESMIKCLGTGFSLNPKNFSLDMSGNRPSPLVWEDTTYYFREYVLAPDHPVAVCSTRNQFAQALHPLNPLCAGSFAETR